MEQVIKKKKGKEKEDLLTVRELEETESIVDYAFLDWVRNATEMDLDECEDETVKNSMVNEYAVINAVKEELLLMKKRRVLSLDQYSPSPYKFPPNLVVPKGKRGRKGMSSCANNPRLDRRHNVVDTTTGSVLMSKDERLAREKLLKKPVVYDDTDDDEDDQEEYNEDEDEDVEEDYYEKGRPKKKRKTPMALMKTSPDTKPISMPENLKEFIKKKKGTEVGLVTVKTLTKTDTSSHQGRLLIPTSQVRTQFLTEKDKGVIYRPRIGDDKHVPGIDVPLYEPSLESSVDLSLRLWHMKTSTNYALVSRWNSVVRRNGLCPGMVVQLWAFRDEGSRLCLALVVA